MLMTPLIQYVKKVWSGIGGIKRIKPFVQQETLQNLYNSLALLYFDYCSLLWDNCGTTLKEKLQKLQNRAARIITEDNYDVRSTDLLHALSWENLNDRHRINKAILTFKILHDDSAPNLKDRFSIREKNLGSYNLRNADINLSVPEPVTEYLKRSFGYSSAVLWNSLPRAANRIFKHFLKFDTLMSESVSDIKWC